MQGVPGLREEIYAKARSEALDTRGPEDAFGKYAGRAI